MNYAHDVIDAAPPDVPALIELARDGSRRCWSFGEISEASARLAGSLVREGLEPGDVVLVWLGNRAEWALTLLACFRLGVVPAACPEQLRAKDLELRVRAISPALVIADRRNAEELSRADLPCRVLWLPDDDLWRSAAPAPAAVLRPDAPGLLSFTSGTSGEPKAVVHLQRYLTGQRLQAEHWMTARPGDVVWCTASSGWSKSARNAFVAPWLRGATALLHDGRFDASERVEIIRREQVNVLCMAPTEYRIVAKRTTIPRSDALRSCVSAGEALDADVLGTWKDATGISIRDGYGQTETGQITGCAPADPVRPGSMGKALPGVRVWLDDGELLVDPATVPTFFSHYGGEEPVSRREPWRTGDRVEIDGDGYLWFNGRADDIIISAGYRIGPTEVESVLCAHDAVEEAAAVAAPDDERGSVVRALVVLREGVEPSGGLARALQDHVKASTAPYKYPRQLEFVEALPKTSSGKIMRAALRSGR